MAAGPPIPNPDCAPVASLMEGSCVVSGRFESRCLDVGARLLGGRERGCERCARLSRLDWRRRSPSASPGTARSMSGRAAVPNLRRAARTHSCRDRAGDGDHGVSAQAEKPLVPGAVHTRSSGSAQELFWVKRSTAVACLSWRWVRAHSRQQGGPRSGRGSSPFPGCRNEV